MIGPSLRYIQVFSILAISLGFEARAEEKPPVVAISTPQRHKIAPRSTLDRKADSSPAVSGGWWWSTAGAASILALAGWASLAGRKFLPKTAVAASGVKVVGRTSLSPKHSVYLLRVGSRVLIVGTGPQGAPSLLGELDPSDAPTKARPSPFEAVAMGTRFDHRLGDDA